MNKQSKCLSFLKITDHAQAPFRGSQLSAGYDLASAYDYKISPGTICKVNTDLVLLFPSGCYGRLAIRSSLAVCGIDILGGVIDPDYRGNIVIVLINHGKQDYEIKRGHRVAQVVCEKIRFPKIFETKTVAYKPLSRNKKGFGSSGV